MTTTFLFSSLVLGAIVRISRATKKPFSLVPPTAIELAYLLSYPPKQHIIRMLLNRLAYLSAMYATKIFILFSLWPFSFGNNL